MEKKYSKYIPNLEKAAAALLLWEWKHMDYKRKA